MYKILIVEDDNSIANSLKTSLSTWGWECDTVKDFNAVMDEFNTLQPDLVLLDISLPFFNGFYWCSQIRQTSKVPIVFISSMSDNMNIVMAMNMGGDDFITKPFDINVLTAKIAAIFRRTYDYTEKKDVIVYEGLELNIGDGSFIFNGENVSLTKNEFKILETLLLNKGRLVSRDNLMVRLWESEAFIDENTLSVNVARLRKKLEAVGLNDMILTKKGMGYMVKSDV